MQVRDAKAEGGGDVVPIPVTVRQLEALVRISESLARMELATLVQSHHVDLAIQLFAASTLDAVRSGLVDTLTFSDEQVCCFTRSAMHAAQGVFDSGCA
jgi:DNA replicative helicase MCM subunit Mcm2 (Cdc46/Mcm family)